MSNKENKKRVRVQRVYTKEFKVEGIKLAREIGNKGAATELGIPEGTLGGWVREAKLGAIDTGVGTQTPETALTQAAEIQKLKAELKKSEKEIKWLKELNEFLEEASSFFASSRQKYARKNDLNS